MRNARRWRSGSRTPVGEHPIRALELTAVVERLVQVMEPSYIPVWLVKPLARLDVLRPVDAIRDEDYRSVSKLVASLEEMPVAKCLPSTSTPYSACSSGTSLMALTRCIGHPTRRPRVPSAMRSLLLLPRPDGQQGLQWTLLTKRDRRQARLQPAARRRNLRGRLQTHLRPQPQRHHRQSRRSTAEALISTQQRDPPGGPRRPVGISRPHWGRRLARRRN